MVLLVLDLVAPGDGGLGQLLELLGEEGYRARPEVRVARRAGDGSPFQNALEHPREAFAASGGPLLAFVEGRDGRADVARRVGQDQPVDVVGP